MTMKGKEMEGWEADMGLVPKRNGGMQFSQLVGLGVLSKQTKFC